MSWFHDLANKPSDFSSSGFAHVRPTVVGESLAPCHVWKAEAAWLAEVAFAAKRSEGEIEGVKGRTTTTIVVRTICVSAAERTTELDQQPHLRESKGSSHTQLGCLGLYMYNNCK